MQKQEFSGKINITIDHPTLVGSATKHHEYRIHGSDDLGQIDVSRRYSDFIILKQYMINRWPGVYIPSLPEKKFIGNNELDFINVRRQGLQSFIFLISQVNYLWYSDQFQLFIKSKSNEVDKFLSNLGKTTPKQIILKYRSKFPSILQSSQKDKTAQQNATKISQFKVYLKNALVVLQKLGKVSQIMAETRKRFNEKYSTLLQTILPEYEQKCTSFHIQDNQCLNFANNKINGLADIQENMSKTFSKNSLSIVNQLIKEQIRQINNFQQILKNKQVYDTLKFKAMSKSKDLQIEESKINSGKQSIMSMIKKTSKQQQLQQNKVQLQKSRQQLKQIQQLCSVLDIILSQDQINRFKQTRSVVYYSIVKQMAKAEKQNCQIEEQFWAKIGGSNGFIVENLPGQKKQQEDQDKLIKVQNIQFLDQKIVKEQLFQETKDQQKVQQKSNEHDQIHD